MQDQDLVKMVHGLEASIKSLKHHLGMEDEYSEPDEDDLEAKPMIKEVGRGRKKRSVPTLGKAPKAEEEELAS